MRIDIFYEFFFHFFQLFFAIFQLFLAKNSPFFFSFFVQFYAIIKLSILHFSNNSPNFKTNQLTTRIEEKWDDLRKELILLQNLEKKKLNLTNHLKVGFTQSRKKEDYYEEIQKKINHAKDVSGRLSSLSFDEGSLTRFQPKFAQSRFGAFEQFGSFQFASHDRKQTRRHRKFDSSENRRDREDFQ